MPWYSTVEDALQSNGAGHSLGDIPTLRAEPDWGWAGYPDTDPAAESRDFATWLRSSRHLDARQALGRWGRLSLLDEDRKVVGAATDTGTLTDLLWSRPDVQPWIATGPSTVLGVSVLDPAELVNAARVPPPPQLPGEPQQAAHVRSLLEARVTGIEATPPVPRVRAALISPGDGLTVAQAGERFTRPAARRSLVWYCWRWPESGWKFKPSASGPGVAVTDYVPADGSRIVHDSVEYRVSWTYSALGREVLDCPTWLLELVGNARHDWVVVRPGVPVASGKAPQGCVACGADRSATGAAATSA